MQALDRQRLDTFAEDLSALMEALDLNSAI